LCPLFAIGHYSMGKALFVSQGRLDMWWAYIKWWAVSANHYVGAGLGSFEWISNMIYSDSHGYTFAHNDYLQVLFELGAIGFALFVVFIATEFYRLRNCGRYFITGCGLCAFMLTYSPLHVFPGMLVAILLCTGGPIGKKVV
jgi:O-antigen ligase